MATATPKKKKRGRRRGKAGKSDSPRRDKPGQDDPAPTLRITREDLPKVAVAGAVLAAAFAWAYWPALVKLVEAWNREPDYSHGYFVVPLAIYFLWARQDKFPGLSSRLEWPGVALLAMSIGIRMFGARYYVDAIDAWSILFWVSGTVWLLAGRRVLWWSMPSIAFLWFMIPLPWRVERWLSLPLQNVATKMSCWGLQCLGQPALYEGNTIHIGEFPLEVEQACSGLRIFVGIVALAFAYVVLVQRAWWQKALLVASVLPIALVANSTRIIATGLLGTWVSGEAAHKFTHDVSGYVMIPFAAGLFALVLWYVGKLVEEVEVVDIGDVVRKEEV